MIDVTFDQPFWQQKFEYVKQGDKISAAEFLTSLEQEDTLCVEEAMSWLDERQISLDISDLPLPELTGSVALRLKQESELSDPEAVTEGFDDNDPLRLYLQELSNMPAFGDLQLLAERYYAGEHHLAEQLVNLSLSMVVQIAMEYTGRGVLLLDLIQEGSLGLWKGIACYCGGDFSQHAQWWISHFMAKAVTQYARGAGVGQKLREGMQDYLDADQRLLGELGRNPTVDEIAQSLHISVSQVLYYEKMVSQARAMVKDTPTDNVSSQEENMAVEDTAYFQLRQRIAELLAVLPAEDAKLLTLRFGLEDGKPLSPVQTGEILGITPQQVLRREEAALDRLRNQ